MSDPRPASRHRSREAALQVLYAVDLARARSEESPIHAADRALDDVARHFELPAGARLFTAELVRGTVGHLDEIDASLARHAAHWRVERMAAVDRNVLRIATWEILHGKTPPPVAIAEAVALARRFGGERSSACVNGGLDGLARAAGEGAA